MALMLIESKAPETVLSSLLWRF